MLEVQNLLKAKDTIKFKFVISYFLIDNKLQNTIFLSNTVLLYIFHFLIKATNGVERKSFQSVDKIVFIGLDENMVI